MRRERPAIIIKKTARGIAPVSAFDEERLASLPVGTEFEAKPLTKRSLPQLRYYFSILSAVVEATEIAPTSAHLHEKIKVELGYVTLVQLFDGTVQKWPDSAALDAMTHEEFQGYFDRAMRLLAERIGVDPHQLLQEAA
jgi:hypothetical protein